MPKLYISPDKYITVENNRKKLTEEIATRKNSFEYYSSFLYLANPDKILKERGEDIAIYEDLRSDDQVRACIRSRKAGVLSMEWLLSPSDNKEIDDFIKQIFDGLSIYNVISQILEAPLFGYKPLEIVYTKKKEGFKINLKGRPCRWFNFNDENVLQFRSKDNPFGAPVEDNRFITAAQEGDDCNPYGFPDLSCCFWWVMFKKGGIKFWLTFIEKYGMPFIFGKVPRGTPEREQEDLLDKLSDMVQDAVGVIPDDSSVEIKEPSGKSASSDIYLNFLNFCNNSISKAILGETMTVENNQNVGSQALGNVHLSVKKEIVEADKRIVEAALNRFITIIANLFFGSVKDYPRFSLYEPKDVDLQLAQRDQILTSSGQIAFTKKYFIKAYGFEEDDILVNENRVSSFNIHEFSEPEKVENIEDAIDFIDSDNKELQRRADELLTPIFKTIEESDNYQDYLDKLIEYLPDRSDEELIEKLNKVIFIAEAMGRLKK